jgi:hypothetical protein
MNPHLPDDASFWKDNEETRLLMREDEENSDDEAPRTATATVPPVLPAFSIRARSTFEDRQVGCRCA